MNIGINPSLNGGIVAVGNIKIDTFHWKMPVVKWENKTVIDPHEFASIIRSIPGENKVVAIEKVDQTSLKNISGVFNIGWSTGVIYGVLAAMQIPVLMPSQHEWQKRIFTGMDKKLGKKRSKRFCDQYWGCNVWDDGLANAACIALWCQLKISER